MRTIIYVLPIIGGVFLKWKGNAQPYVIIVSITAMILSLFCTTHADYSLYETLYARYGEIASSWGSRPVWGLLSWLGYQLDLPYNWFSGIIAAVSTYMIGTVARKVSPNTPFFLALILIYPGLINLVQLRQYFASALLLCAIDGLISSGKMGKLRFIICIALAAGVHSSAIVFLPLLFVGFFERHSSVFVVLTLVSLVLGLTGNILNSIALAMFNSDVTEAYFNGQGGGANTLTSIFTVFEVFGAFLLAKCVEKELNNGTSDIVMGNKTITRLIKITNLINILFIAILPVLIINTDFLRLHRYALLVNAILYSCVVYQNNRIIGSVYKILFTVYYFAILYFLYWINVFDVTIAPMLGLS